MSIVNKILNEINKCCNVPNLPEILEGKSNQEAVEQLTGRLARFLIERLTGLS